MNTLKRKLASRSGFTLTEMLIAVAIMGILFSTIVMGVNSAVHVYRRSVMLSDSLTLSSTVSNALENELRYARNIRVVDETVFFDSDSFGPSVTVALNGGGRVTVGGAEAGGTQYELLSDKAYTSGLSAVIDQLSYNEGLFSVTLTVSGPKIADRVTELSIRALNR